MSDELKPCPFCGGKAKKISMREEYDGDFWWIACTKCGVLTPVYYMEKNAVDAWNKRITNRKE